MFGNAPMAGSGITPQVQPAMPVPSVPQSPSVPPASMNQSNPKPFEENPLGMIMKTILDPKSAAKELAAAGIGPEQIQSQIQGKDKVSSLIQPTAGAPSDSAKPKPFSFSQVASDLMQPIGGSRSQHVIDPGTPPVGAQVPNKMSDLIRPENVAQNVNHATGAPSQPFSLQQMLTDLMQPIGKAPMATASATPGAGIPVPPLNAQLPVVPPVANAAGQASPGANLPQVPIAPPIVPPASVATTPTPAKVGQGWTPEQNTPVVLQDKPTNAGARERTLKGLPSDISSYIDEIGTKYGLDPNYLKTQAMIESGGNPNAHNASGADGLFQFIPSTAKQYGIAGKTRDWKASTDAAARLALDNKQFLQKNLGREPTYGELYLAHQQGMKGAYDLLSNPDKKASDVVGAAAVRQNGGNTDMTAGEFASMWTNKYNNYGGVSGDGAPAGSAVAGGAGADAVAGGTSGASPTSGLSGLASGLTDPGDGGQNADMNLPDAPSPIGPRPGQYAPDANVQKMMLMLLTGLSGGGADIPSIAALMNGGGRRAA